MAAAIRFTCVHKFVDGASCFNDTGPGSAYCEVHQPENNKKVVFDPVNNPSHYGGSDNPYEAIKVIEVWKLGFNLGNTLKYIAREALKGTALEDLKKARWYLDREIANREKAK